MWLISKNFRRRVASTPGAVEGRDGSLFVAPRGAVVRAFGARQIESPPGRHEISKPNKGPTGSTRAQIQYHMCGASRSRGGQPMTGRIITVATMKGGSGK